MTYFYNWRRFAAMLVIVFSGLPALLSAQSFSPYLAANETDDQYASGVAVDAAGNSYVAGWFKSYHTYFDANYVTDMYNTDAGGTTEDGYVAQYDNAGNVQWAVQVGSSGNNDRCVSVSLMPDGSGDYYIYVVGWYTGTATFTSTGGGSSSLTAVGGQDAFIARYNSSGVLDWAYNIGGSGTDYAYSVSANKDHSNDHVVYVSGRFGGASVGFDWFHSSTTLNNINGSDEGYIVKYDDDVASNFTFDWAREVSSSSVDVLYSLASTPSNVSAGGYIRGTATIQTNGSGDTTTQTISGSYDAFAVNYNSGGTYVWKNAWGASGISVENTTAIAMDNDGNTYAGGYTNGGASGWDAFVRKVNTSGTVVWTQQTTNTNDDYVQCINVDHCGSHVYVGGVYKGSYTFASLSYSSFSVTPNNDGFYAELDAGTGSGITSTNVRFAGDAADVVASIGLNTYERVTVIGYTLSSIFWCGGTNVFTNTDTKTESFIANWTEYTWPAVATAGYGAAHKGLSIDACTIFAGGTLNGSSTFGGTNHTSSVTSMSVSTDDVYLTALSRFGKYTTYTMVATGSSNEQLMNQVSDAANAAVYLAGDAISTASGSNTIVFNNSSSWFGNNSATNAFICKTDETGAVQWVDIAKSNASTVTHGYGVTRDGSGNYYMCGSITGTTTFQNSSTALSAIGTEDAYIVKYNSTGTLQWAKVVASGGAGKTVRALGIANDGTDIYITGTYAGTTTFYSGSGNQSLNAGANGNEIFVARYNSSGDVQSVGGYVGGANLDQGERVYASSSSEVYVTGFTNSASKSTFTGRISLTSATPTTTWTWTKSGSSSFGKGLAKSGGYIYVTGQANNGATFGGLSALSLSVSSPYIMKYLASNGTEQSIVPYSFASAATAYAIVADGSNDDNVFIDGDYHGFVLQNSNGQFYRHHGPRPDQAPTTAVLSSAIYPNPNSGQFTLSLSVPVAAEAPVTLAIFDMSGRLAHQVDGIVSPTVEVNSDLADGTYLYRVIRNGQAISNGKITIAH